MKTFLAIALFVMLCFIGVKGQAVDLKAKGNRLIKAMHLEKSYGIPTIGDKLKMQYPNLLKTPVEIQLKSASEGYQKLDSSIVEVLDSTNSQLFVSSKTTYAYSDNGNMSVLITYYLDDSTKQLTQYSKNEYTYNANGYIILDSEYKLDLLNQWYIWSKDEYKWDNADNLTLEEFYEWNETNNQRRDIYKKEYTYDENFRISQIYSYWDDSNDKWVADFKLEYYYDTNWYNTINFGYSPGGTTNQWDLYYREDYVFDSIGNMTSATYSYGDTSEWYVDMKTLFTHDANGNMTLDSTFWEEYNSEQFIFKNEHTYDSNSNRTSTLFYYRNETNSQWILGQKTTFYYSEFIPTSAPGISGKEIRVYPNPAKEYIVFDLANISPSATVELFDLHGKKVLEQKLSGDNRLVISNLPSGIYLYRLYDSGSVYNGKVTVD